MTAEHKNDEHHVDVPSPGIGILGRYPVLSVLLFAAIGVGVGIGLSYWEPDDDSKDLTLTWIGLIGDMFIRSLKAIVLPLVFINVVLSVVTMMTVGKAGSIGWKTIIAYLLTTMIAALLGVLSIVIFRPLYSVGTFSPVEPATVTLGCNAEGSFLAELPNGSISCTSDLDDADNTFIINDVSGYFVKESKGAANDITLSETIYEGIFRKLITDNIFDAFTTANFAAVVFFAIVFGMSLSRVMDKMSLTEQGMVLQLFKELDQVFLNLINWVIMITPFAVFSLITKAVGSQSDLTNSFQNVGYLVLTFIVAMLGHFFFVYGSALFFIGKHNPVQYLRHFIPAQTMAFACASSAATIPVTLRCARSTNLIPDPICRFVIPLGATVNMDGGAIYFPCACVWLAVLNGIDVNIADYILLIIIATIGSIGTAPVPSASLVLIITAYNTVFSTSGTPDGFSYIFAIDFFMDRLRTTLNVTGDGVVAGIVATLCPLAEEDMRDVKINEMENSSGSDPDEVKNQMGLPK